MLNKNLREFKEYPNDYPKEIINIIDAISFSNNAIIVGSMSMRSQLYAGDYDCYEIVKCKTCELETRFKNIVNKLLQIPNLYIGDIKLGSIFEWQIINPLAYVKKDKVMKYYAIESRSKLKRLFDRIIINSKIYDGINKLLINNPDPQQFMTLKEACKFNIVRWKPKDVLRGYTILKDRSKYTLREALESNSIKKLDVIAFIQNNKYTDFSIIYEINQEENIDVKQSFKEDVLNYYNMDNYFKMTKRIFALNNATNTNQKLNVKLSELFNADLGRIYSVYSDIQTMLFILENESNISFKRMEYEVDNFKTRLSNVNEIVQWFKKGKTIIKLIDTIVDLPNNKSSKNNYIKSLNKIETIFMKILNLYTEKLLKSEDIFPPTQYFP